MWDTSPYPLFFILFYLKSIRKGKRAVEIKVNDAYCSTHVQSISFKSLKKKGLYSAYSFSVIVLLNVKAILRMNGILK
jgi:hypothetical protein